MSKPIIHTCNKACHLIKYVQFKLSKYVGEERDIKNDFYTNYSPNDNLESKFFFLRKLLRMLLEFQYGVLYIFQAVISSACARCKAFIILA